MSNPSKAKGTRMETQVVEYLTHHGVPCERRALAGAQDKGDIAGVPGWVLEVKNHRSMALANWCTEAERERLAAAEGYWAVIHKRYRRGIADAYVTVSLETFAKLLH